MAESRVQKTLLNAKVNLIFYFLNLAVTFFSRKVFLDSLGADFFGLTSTIGGFISFLSLVELGIGSAIGFTLYKPMFEKDYKKLNEIISVLGYLYYLVGFVILGCAIILACTFPFLFEGKNVSLLLVYAVFITFLTGVLLTYFVNYRQSIISADQRSYVVTGGTQAASILCYIFQWITVYYTNNPYLWLAIFFMSNIGCAIYINVKINKMYPWLDAKISLGREKWKEYPEVIKKTKQLFLHKIAYFAQLQMRPLIMFNFASLESIGKYDNYNLTTGKTSSLITYVLSGNVAGVGNLVAEGDKSNINKVYWELFALKFFIAGVLAFGLWYLTEPFLTCWLGEEYLLTKQLLLLIIVNEFIIQTRYSTDAFISAYGLFQDVWAPVTEAVISVVVAVIGGYFWGLEGVLLGTIVSMSIIVGIWKPYFLFSRGFNSSVITYWTNYLKYILCFAAAFIMSTYIIEYIAINPAESFLNWVIYAVIIVLIFAILYAVVLYTLTKGTRDLFQRFLPKLTNKLSKR